MDRSRHYSFHFVSLHSTWVFPSESGRLVFLARGLHSLADRPLPIRWGIPEAHLLGLSHFSLLTSHFPPHCRNAENSDFPNGDQMQFISKQSNSCGFFFRDSISCFSPFVDCLFPHWKGIRSISPTQISQNSSDRVKSLISQTCPFSDHLTVGAIRIDW
jgi:hypothetical protein